MRKQIWAVLSALLLTLLLIAGCGEAGGLQQTLSESVQELTLAETVSQHADAAGQSAAEAKESAPPAAETEALSVGRNAPQPETEALLPKNGSYNSKEEVALYLAQYGHLPDNYITKKEAQNLGWSGGSLEPYAPGKSIGGGRFGNYEGLLPEAKGRTYWECDIDTAGKKSRGAKRIVFSNDGLIYYTDDHYDSFELLYGEE